MARAADAGATGAGGFLQGLLTGQVWPVLTGLGALAAGGYALARRPAADFALALAGACLAIFAGAANAAVFSRAVVPVSWAPVWARVAAAAVIAAGAGIAAAGTLRLRTAASQPRPAPPTPPRRSRTSRRGSISVSRQQVLDRRDSP